MTKEAEGISLTVTQIKNFGGHNISHHSAKVSIKVSICHVKKASVLDIIYLNPPSITDKVASPCDT